MNKYINYVKSKIWFVLLCGVIISTALVIEKNYFSSYVVQSGDVLYTRIVKLINTSEDDNKLEQDFFRYGKLMNTYPVIDEFQNKYNSKYSFRDFSLNWDKLKKEEKYKWQQKHIIINEAGAGVFEICLWLKSSDPKNLKYVEENGESFLDDYIQYSNCILENLELKLHIKEFNRFAMLPEEIKIDKNTILLKYAILGFLLGSLFGITFLCLKVYKDTNNG